MLKIGELAKCADVSVDTLRFYERLGLIRAQRAANGYRLYPAETGQLLGYIKLAQGLGFTLAEIGENLPLLWQQSDATPAYLAQVFGEKIAALDARIGQLQQLRSALAARAGQLCPLAPAG